MPLYVCVIVYASLRMLLFFFGGVDVPILDFIFTPHTFIVFMYLDISIVSFGKLHV